MEDNFFTQSTGKHAFYAIVFAVLASLSLHGLVFAGLVMKLSSFETAEPVVGIISITLKKQPTFCKSAASLSPEPPVASGAERHASKSRDAIAPRKSHLTKKYSGGRTNVMNKKNIRQENQGSNSEAFTNNSSVPGHSSANLTASAYVPPAPAGGGYEPRPAYPELARKRGQEGTARVRCQIDAAGQVVDVSLAASSGFRLLDDAALKAVGKWKFKPATKNGVNVPGSVIVPVQFKLR